MGAIDRSLFLWLNAPDNPADATVAIAVFLGEYLIWLLPGLLVAGWLFGSREVREAMLVATASACFGLLVTQLVRMGWPQPRPFMLGLGHQLIRHAPAPSCPSNHLTLWWSVSCSLLLQRGPRRRWILLVLAGLAVAWARIYAGIHFPSDMLAAALVSVSCAWLSLRCAHWYLDPLYRLASGIYYKLCGRLIRMGWLYE